MITLVKFIPNYKEDSNNKLITRTLGKLGVLSKTTNIFPKSNEWWYCEIVKEVGKGSAKGVFVLEPKKRLEDDENGKQRILYLYPGSFTMNRKENILYMYPNKPGYPWICPISMRRHLLNKFNDGTQYGVNAIIVVHEK